MRTFSDEAREWLSNYHGSIDSTALLLAFDAGMSSERVGATTHGALNRDAARTVLVDHAGQWTGRMEQSLDALEACVVPDPRIAEAAVNAERARIKAAIQRSIDSENALRPTNPTESAMQFHFTSELEAIIKVIIDRELPE